MAPVMALPLPNGSDIHVTAYSLNGQSKSQGQAAVQVLLRSGPSFLREWMQHT